MVNGRKGPKRQTGKVLLLAFQVMSYEAALTLFKIVNETCLRGRTNSWDVHPCRYFRVPPVRGKGESFFFFLTVSFTHAFLCGQGTRVALWKVGTLSLLSEPRFCILSHTQHGGQGLSSSPWRRWPCQLWWLGGQGSTGRQSTENKGAQEHELANTPHARSFKKYILFLNSCQQFLQIFKPLEICSLFPLVFFLCVCVCIDRHMYVFIIVGVLGQILWDEEAAY